VARDDWVNHSWKVTVSGGIRVRVLKVGEGGVVETVMEQLRGGQTVYVRCEVPGLVRFKRTEQGVAISKWAYSGAPDPDAQLILPWAGPLIQRVKELT
jgi:hypothetical protein